MLLLLSSLVLHFLFCLYEKIGVNYFKFCCMISSIGGAAYRPPKNISNAILMDDVKCSGNEPSLMQCSYKKWSVHTGCDFYSERAGVFCYNDTGN